MTVNPGRIRYLTEWATRWSATLQLEGSIGFGRDCVGILKGSSYIDYMHIYDLEPQPEFWSPEDAYHKHDCLAVLGHGDDAINQLYEWVTWLDSHGWTVEVVDRQPDHALDAMFHGFSTPRLVPPTEPVEVVAILEPSAESLEDEIKRLRAQIVELQKDSDFLNRLRNAGVDNWEGYSQACSDKDDD